MWANAQRDGRPAEYKWRPLFNAAKFGSRPLIKCRAVTLPRRDSQVYYVNKYTFVQNFWRLANVYIFGIIMKLF